MVGADGVGVDEDLRPAKGYTASKESFVDTRHCIAGEWRRSDNGCLTEG